MLQYNKIYQSLKKVSAEWHAGHVQWEYYWDYLKFYEDGMVIQASITSDNFEKINLNFNKNNSNIEKGKFKLSDKEIKLQFSEKRCSGGITKELDLVLYIENQFKWEKYYLTH